MSELVLVWLVIVGGHELLRVESDRCVVGERFEVPRSVDTVAVPRGAVESGLAAKRGLFIDEHVLYRGVMVSGTRTRFHMRGVAPTHEGIVALREVFGACDWSEFKSSDFAAVVDRASSSQRAVLMGGLQLDAAEKFPVTLHSWLWSNFDVPIGKTGYAPFEACARDERSCGALRPMFLAVFPRGRTVAE